MIFWFPFQFKNSILREALSVAAPQLGSFSRDIFEQHPSTGSGHFALLASDFDQIFVSIRVKILGNTNLSASRYIKRKMPHFRPVDVPCPKTSLLKDPCFHSLNWYSPISTLRLLPCLEEKTILWERRTLSVIYNECCFFATGISEKGTGAKRSRTVGGKTRSVKEKKRGKTHRQRGNKQKLFLFFLEFCRNPPYCEHFIILATY